MTEFGIDGGAYWTAVSNVKSACNISWSYGRVCGFKSGFIWNYGGAVVFFSFGFLWFSLVFFWFSSGFLLFSLGFLLFSSGFLTVLNRRKLKKTKENYKKTIRKLKKTKEN